MATNGAHDVEDAEMAECDGEKVVTMMDVLQEEQDFEDDANAVLGASDEKNCTYSKGYIKRQAIYACLTCCSEAKYDPTKRAGVCLACSLSCHENHELIELYTKRNFRCDCGNSKFNSHPCQFTPDKNDLNDENSYNQNFSGLYCNCHRPYPDPEATIEDEEMIQCIICEDWLHASHLDAIVPANDQYTEMVCKDCMEKNDFLHDYNSLAVNVESGDVDVITNNSNNTSVSNGDLETKKILNGTGETTEDVTEEHITEMDTNTKNTDLCNGDLGTEKILNGTGETSEDTTEEPKSNMDTNSKNTNLNNEDLVTEKIENGTDETPDDTIEELKSDMDVDKSVTDNTETMDNLEVEKPEENVTDETESIDETKKAENSEEQISSVVSSNGNEDTETAVTLKTKSKDIDDSLKTSAPEDKDIIQQEFNETPAGNSEESKDITERPQEPLDSKEVEETSDQDNPANVASQESPNKNTETCEAEKEISSEKETVNLERNEVIDKITEPASEDGKGEEVNKVESEDSNAKRAEVMQTDAENIVITDDNKNPATENESKSNFTDIEMSEVTREPETKEVNTNKTDNVETEIPADESTSETETSDSLSQVEPEATSKDVISDEPPKNTDEINKENSINTDKGNEENNLKADEENKENSINTDEENKENNINTDEENKENNINTDEENKENNINTDDENKENKRKLSTEDITEDICVKKPKLDDENKCTRPKSVRRMHTGATFWPSNFRQKLCTCSECISMYKELSVLFLTDPEDTVFAYETLGKERVHGRATQYEKGLEALSSLGRIQQINALTEYNKMKDKLLDFLKSFKDRKEIVKEDDIKEFFAGMKPKREPDGVYFCR